jgi:hypothetical protein
MREFKILEGASMGNNPERLSRQSLLLLGR